MISTDDSMKTVWRGKRRMVRIDQTGCSGGGIHASWRTPGEVRKFARRLLKAADDAEALERE